MLDTAAGGLSVSPLVALRTMTRAASAALFVGTLRAWFLKCRAVVCGARYPWTWGGFGPPFSMVMSSRYRPILSSLNEGQAIEYEEVSDKGKTSAGNLRAQR
jgi:hypothetical protein